MATTRAMSPPADEPSVPGPSGGPQAPPGPPNRVGDCSSPAQRPSLVEPRHGLGGALAGSLGDGDAGQPVLVQVDPGREGEEDRRVLRSRSSARPSTK